MKQVFTDQNIAIVGLAKSLLEQHGIDCQLRNEYASSVMGEVAFFDVWPEVWVADDDAQSAMALMAQIRSPKQDTKTDWQCRRCQEINPGTFETCWQCSGQQTAVTV